MNTRERDLPMRQGRELREDFSGIIFKTGGICHAVGFGFILPLFRFAFFNLEPAFKGLPLHVWDILPVWQHFVCLPALLQVANTAFTLIQKSILGAMYDPMVASFTPLVATLRQ